MTWNRTLATGSGRLRFRVSIEGIGTDAVTHAAMERDAGGTDGRARRTGLSIKGVKLSQRADLVRATVEAKGATFVLADVGEVWTSVLNTQPTAVTWLTDAISASDTTIPVKSTAAFPSSEQYIWVNSECMKVEIDDIVGFSVTERGVFDTLPQAHYVPDGAFLRAPMVSDQPVLFTGRRVRLFVYGAGDDPQGDGTQIWLGVLTGEPRMEGASWTLSVDPISSLLDQEVGADLSEAVQPRGIFLPAPVKFQIGRIPYSSGAITAIPGFLGQPATDFVVVGVPAGFYETQADFIETLNAQLSAATSSWNATVTAAADDYGYHFIVSNDATPDGVMVYSYERPLCEPLFAGNLAQTDGSVRFDSDFQLLFATQNASYTIWPNPDNAMRGAGLVPRGVFNRYRVTPSGIEFARVYVGGSVAITSNVSGVSVSWQGDTASGDFEYAVGSFDTASRHLVLIRESPPVAPPPTRYYTPGSLPTIRFGRNFSAYPGTGTYNLLKTIEEDNPEQLNTGAVPSFRDGDWDSASWLDAYSSISAMGSQRAYSSLKPVKLIDFVAPDLQLAGHYLSFDSAGRLTIKPLRLAAPTESATFQITKSNLLTDDGFPSYERGAVGQFNTLIVHDGYSPSTDEYTLPPIKVRDVAAYGQSPVARVIKIEPKSGQRGTFVPIEDATALASQVLGIFGAPYAYIQCAVPLTALSGSATTIGSTVSISTAQLPSARGLRGVTDLAAIVVARDIDLYGARVELTLLASLARIAGYAFGALITSQTNTTGNTWEIEVSADYFAGSDTAADHVEEFDDLLVYRFDSATAGTQHCTVTAVSGNVLTVDFDGAWTPGSDEWCLTQVDADDVDESPSESQKRYAYVAADDGMIGYDGGAESARQFAP